MFLLRQEDTSYFTGELHFIEQQTTSQKHAADGWKCAQRNRDVLLLKRKQIRLTKIGLILQKQPYNSRL